MNDKRCGKTKEIDEQQSIITELNKQIEQLLLAIDDLLSHTSCEEIKKENEQLHLAIDDLLTHTSCGEVKKEHSDLRQNIKMIKDLLSECDLFSDKATEHDIIAYSEMLDFDNKDAYSIACSIAKIKKVINDE